MLKTDIISSNRKASVCSYACQDIHHVLDLRGGKALQSLGQHPAAALHEVGADDG